MNIIDLSKYIHNEELATDLLEEMRWPDGRVCPYCGSLDSYRLRIKSVKRRRYKCTDCRKQFTVSVGTVMEDSHIAFGKWLYAIYQMCIAKKGVSAKQLQRELGMSYKSAWFMCHRIRYAMTQDPLMSKLKGVVEIDEAYLGGNPQNKPPKKVGERTPGRSTKKLPIVSLVERHGKSRSFAVDDVTSVTLKKLAYDNVHVKSDVMTDGWVGYKGLKGNFKSHQTVDHNKQFVRGIVHVNFAESYFSLLKRGLVGTFHHVSKKHLQRYLDEFDFRWSTRKIKDVERVLRVIRGLKNKRLMYKSPKIRKSLD